MLGGIGARCFLPAESSKSTNLKGVSAQFARNSEGEIPHCHCSAISTLSGFKNENNLRQKVPPLSTPFYASKA